MRHLIRATAHTVRETWCVISRRCHLNFDIDDLKRGDDRFASHMEWMKEKEQASRNRQEHVLEDVFLRKQRQPQRRPQRQPQHQPQRRNREEERR